MAGIKKGQERVRLGDLIKIAHGWPFKSEFFTERRKGRPIIVSIGNFQYTGGFRFESTTVKEYIGDYPQEYELSPRDILLVMTCQTAGGEILGIPGRIPDDGKVYLHNQRMGKVVVKEPSRIDPDFVYYLALWPDFNRELFVSASGTKILHTAPVRIEAFEFDLPPLPEQKAIASVLGALDDKIELNRRMNATLESMARALFQSWFVDFDPVRAKLDGRPPEGMDPSTAALFPNSFQDSPLGPIPKGWEVRKFESFIRRLPVGQKYEQKTVLPSGAIPVLDQGKSGVIGFHNNEPGVQASLDEPVAVFANHTCYMRLITCPFSAIQNVLPFVGLGVDTRWAYYATVGRMSFSEYKGHWPDFCIQEAVVPRSELADAFSETVKPMISRIQINEANSHSLAIIRDTLLPKLLSGELTLSQSHFNTREGHEQR